MAFERFVGTGRSYAARLSISRAGLISFNNGVTKRFGLDKFSHCVLFFDKEGERIGIKMTSDETEPGARKIRFREAGADVAAKVFFDYYGITAKETMVYEP